MSELIGTVFNIQRFTVHDGPGIRTEIFLSGCPLHCKWCSNPEGFVNKQQVGVYYSKCIGVDKCGLCLKACKKHALMMVNGKIGGISRDLCVNCLSCYKACPSDALKLWGKRMTVQEVMDVILDDVEFYEQSGGGVTISGGEAFVQHEFTTKVLEQCKEQGIHTCVETTLHTSRNILDQVLLWVDMIITDIKHMDSVVHRANTGVGNEKILANIKYLADIGKTFVIRIPIIPDVNDSEEHIDRIANFILGELHNRAVQVQFLRFRRLGEEKYASLGIPYQMSDVDPDREQFEGKIKQLVKRMSDRGIPAVAGTTRKYNA